MSLAASGETAECLRAPLDREGLHPWFVVGPTSQKNSKSHAVLGSRRLGVALEKSCYPSIRFERL